MPATHPGARPPAGGWIVSVGRPLRASSHEITEFGFHISPVQSWSRPQIGAGSLHNAIVHNLPEHGTVQVKTAIRPESVTLTVENTGDKLTPHLVSTLTEPFQRGTERILADHAGVGLGLAIVKSIPKHTTEPSPSPPGPLGGSASRCNCPPRHRTLADDDQRNCGTPERNSP
jgi:hypothetical protein